MKFLRRKSYGPAGAGESTTPCGFDAAPVGRAPLPDPERYAAPSAGSDGEAIGAASWEADDAADPTLAQDGPPSTADGLRRVVRNGGDEALFGASSRPSFATPGAGLAPNPQAPAAEPAPAAMPSARESAATRIATAERAADETPPPAAEPEDEAATAAPEPQDDSPVNLGAIMASVAVPSPTAGRTAGRAGRAKTRLLGFAQQDETADPFAAKAAPQQAAAAQRFPVGWLVVVDGPGRGAHFTLFNGVSQIGRGEDQTVRLDFGDNTISRTGHALLAYDDEQAKFFLGSGGKVNIVRLNDRPLLSTEELSHDDVIRIGETRLRFVAFCGPDFAWSADERDDDGR